MWKAGQDACRNWKYQSPGKTVKKCKAIRITNKMTSKSFSILKKATKNEPIKSWFPDDGEMMTHDTDG